MTNWGASGLVNGVATNVETGTLFWNTNGTLHQVVTTDTYNPVNNNLTCTYLYDDLARLASDSCSTGWLQTITYDGYGSIIKQGNASLNVAYPYDDTNKNNHFLLSATGITYDNMGDVTKDDLNNTYAYDAEGRPVIVNSVSTTFDAFNRAVEQYSNGVATQIVYSPTGQAKFAFTNGQTLKSYVLPMVAGMQVVYNSTGLQYFRQVDWLGNGCFATNASGGVYYDASYGPAGESLNEMGRGIVCSPARRRTQLRGRAKASMTSFSASIQPTWDAGCRPIRQGWPPSISPTPRPGTVMPTWATTRSAIETRWD